MSRRPDGVLAIDDLQEIALDLGAQGDRGNIDATREKLRRVAARHADVFEALCRFIEAGHAVTAFDIDPRRLQEGARHGPDIAASAAAAVSGAEARAWRTLKASAALAVEPLLAAGPVNRDAARRRKSARRSGSIACTGRWDMGTL